MKPRLLQTAIRIIACLLFLGVLARIIDWQLMRDAMQYVHLEILALATLLYLCNIAIRAYRWQRLFNKDALEMSFKDAYLITLVGTALNIFIPATLGDLARSYYGYKRYGLKEQMVSTVLSDKVFALCSLFLFGGISGFIMGYYGLGCLSLALAAATCLPLFFPRTIPWNLVNTFLNVFKKSLDVDKLVRAFTLPVRLKFEAMVLSFGVWLCTCVFFYSLCTAFPVTVRFGYILLIMPILTIVRLFPFTVNSLGPPEIALAYFFHSLGINSTFAVLISLLSNLLASIIPGTIGFLIIITQRHKKPHHIRLENNVDKISGA